VGDDRGLFIGHGKPRDACGTETKYSGGGSCSRPIRTELGDDRWVPPTGPTSQRAAGAGAGLRARALGRCGGLGWGREAWGGWAARCAAGPRPPGPRGRAGGKGRGGGLGRGGGRPAQDRVMALFYFK